MVQTTTNPGPSALPTTMGLQPLSSPTDPPTTDAIRLFSGRFIRLRSLSTQRLGRSLYVGTLTCFNRGIRQLNLRFSLA
jgi:hypothetical protein